MGIRDMLSSHQSVLSGATNSSSESHRRLQQELIGTGLVQDRVFSSQPPLPPQANPIAPVRSFETDFVAGMKIEAIEGGYILHLNLMEGMRAKRFFIKDFSKLEGILTAQIAAGRMTEGGK